MSTLPSILDWCVPEWGKVFEAFGPDGYLNSEAVYDSSCFPLQRKNELRKMMRIAASINPKVIYEIGSSRGGGLVHWPFYCKNVKKIIACDVNGHPFDKLFEKNFPDISWRWISKSSRNVDVREATRTWLGKSLIDVLFIDGEKKDMKLDFDHHLHMMSPNGIIFLHDIQSVAHSAWEKIQKQMENQHTCFRLVDTIESVDEILRERRKNPTAYQQHLLHFRGNSAGVGVVLLNRKFPVVYPKSKR